MRNLLIAIVVFVLLSISARRCERLQPVSTPKTAILAILQMQGEIIPKLKLASDTTAGFRFVAAARVTSTIHVVEQAATWVPNPLMIA